MKKISVFILCIVFLASSAIAARLPRILKTPKTCEIVKVEDEGMEKSYFLKCKKPLTKRMRGWIFVEKTRFRKVQEREWTSRRGDWRLVEESICRLRTCKVTSIIVFKIVGC